jgi:glycosyltransferase involved in cell wall biosynthesis
MGAPTTAQDPERDPERPIRVAHIATTLNIGGAEQLLLDLCRRFPALGVEPTVTYIKGRGPFTPEFEDAGIPVRRVKMMAALDPFLVPRLAHHLERLEPDIVHTHMFKADLHGALAAWMAGVDRLISTKHAADEQRAWWPVAVVDRWLARRSDAILAVSADMARFTVDVEGFPEEHIKVILNGIDLARARPTRGRASVRHELDIPQDAPLVLATARLHYSKGHKVLLEAMRSVRAELPEAILAIAGDGDERNHLMRLAHPDGVAVRFLGVHRDIGDLLGACDCYVLPSLREGLGLSCVEAMAAGCPAVATTVGGLPEVLTDGVDGLAIPPGDAPAMARAILRLLQDRELAARLAANAQVKARERFDVDRTASEYAALYRQVLTTA